MGKHKTRRNLWVKPPVKVIKQKEYLEYMLSDHFHVGISLCRLTGWVEFSFMSIGGTSGDEGMRVALRDILFGGVIAEDDVYNKGAVRHMEGCASQPLYSKIFQQSWHMRLIPRGRSFSVNADYADIVVNVMRYIERQRGIAFEEKDFEFFHREYFKMILNEMRCMRSPLEVSPNSDLKKIPFWLLTWEQRSAQYKERWQKECAEKLAVEQWNKRCGFAKKFGLFSVAAGVGAVVVATVLKM